MVTLILKARGLYSTLRFVHKQSFDSQMYLKISYFLRQRNWMWEKLYVRTVQMTHTNTVQNYYKNALNETPKLQQPLDTIANKLNQ